jgi:hypothetical protein
MTERSVLKEVTEERTEHKHMLFFACDRACNFRKRILSLGYVTKDGKARLKWHGEARRQAKSVPERV